MLAPRWRKVLRDIAEAPAKAGVAVLAMATGVFGTAMILTSSTILTRELAVTYESTRPASAILVARGVTDAVVEQVRARDDVRDAEARPVVRGRARVGADEWVPITLFVVRDFSDLRIDTFAADQGRLPVASNDVVIERSAMSVAKADVGDSLTVRVGESGELPLRVSGTVHAAGLAPGWMDHVVSGWVTWDSLARAGAASDLTGLRLVVEGDRADANHIRAIARDVAGALAASGVVVVRTEIPPPGRHPHADQMDTFLYLLGAFGLLALVLGAVLVATMIHALLADQVRQIGILKALGASSAQVASMYLGQVACLAAGALAVGMPLGYLAGRAYADFAAGILNATIASGRVPAWAVVVEIVLGLGVPLAIALRPVVRAARIPVREALDTTGRGDRPRGARPGGHRAGVTWLPRLWGLSIRAALEQRGRLVLTVGTLVAGGVVFMAALNTSAAWDVLLAREGLARPYDLDVRLAKSYDARRVFEALREAPTIARVEEVRERTATVPLAGAEPLRVVVAATDPASPLLRLDIVDGRWLGAGDRAGVVVNTALRTAVPGLATGSRLTVRFGDREAVLDVIGVAREMNPQPTAYVAPELEGAFDEAPGTVRALRIVTTNHDAGAQLAGQRAVERALSSAGIEVAGLVRVLDRRQAFADHLVIIESALLFAAVLVVFVGGLGLASTLSLNVLERTREMGILGAIGATPGVLARMVVFEGLVVAVASWVIALLLALPVTAVITRVAGQMFHKAPLDFVMSPAAAAAWLALVVALGAATSLYPAWRAARLPIREALHHV